MYIYIYNCASFQVLAFNERASQSHLHKQIVCLTYQSYPQKGSQRRSCVMTPHRRDDCLRAQANQISQEIVGRISFSLRSKDGGYPKVSYKSYGTFRNWGYTQINHLRMFQCSTNNTSSFTGTLHAPEMGTAASLDVVLGFLSPIPGLSHVLY